MHVYILYFSFEVFRATEFITSYFLCFLLPPFPTEILRHVPVQGSTYQPSFYTSIIRQSNTRERQRFLSNERRKKKKKFNFSAFRQALNDDIIYRFPNFWSCLLRDVKSIARVRGGLCRRSVASTLIMWSNADRSVCQEIISCSRFHHACRFHFGFFSVGRSKDFREFRKY